MQAKNRTEQYQEIRQATVGKFLKTKREKAGKTQRDVSDVLDYDTAQFVSNWERGVSTPPKDPSVIRKIAVTIKCKPEEIIDKLQAADDKILALEYKDLRKGVR